MVMLYKRKEEHQNCKKMRKDVVNNSGIIFCFFVLAGFSFEQGKTQKKTLVVCPLQSRVFQTFWMV